MGTDPIISITAKSVNTTVTSSLKLKGMIRGLYKGIAYRLQGTGFSGCCTTLILKMTSLF
jgi:hypothetical protein